MGKDAVIVGHSLSKSTTAQLTPMIWPITEPAHLQGKLLVLVDTLGFDDNSYTSDWEILRGTAITLASLYVDHIISPFITRLMSTLKDMTLT